MFPSVLLVAAWLLGTPVAPKAGGQPEIREGQSSYVEKVADGDTLLVRLLPEGTRLKIRLLGIDCPESHKNAKCERDAVRQGIPCADLIPAGLRAARRAAALFKHKTLRLESPKGDGKFTRDVYGRLLAYVRLEDGRDFGLQMIRDGLCDDFGWKYPHPRGRQYGEAGNRAGRR